MPDVPKAPDELEALVRQQQQVILHLVRALAATVERRLTYLCGHQARVASLACAIARAMPPDVEIETEGLHIAAMLHDVGMISLPHELMTRTGAITELEKRLLEGHPEIGYSLLASIPFPWPVAEIVLQHHEHLDGSGYPYGLKGDQIRLESQIVLVADFVDAVTSPRPHRPAHPIEMAYQHLRQNAGILYDRRVVAAYFAVAESVV